MNLIVCPTCSGSGYEGRRVCHECRGAARGLIFGNYFLHWGRQLSDFDIKLRRIKDLIDDVVNAFALAVAGGTIALFFYYLYQIKFQRFLDPSFWKSDIYPVKLFWLGVLALLFLIYRLRSWSEYIQPVMRKKYGETVPELKEAGWADAKNLRKKFWIDVSRSFGKETIRVIEDGYVIARRWKHSEAGLIHLFAALLKNKKVQYVFIRLGAEKYRDITELVRRALPREKKTSGFPDVNLKVFEILIRAYIEAFIGRETLVNVLPVLSLVSLEDKTIGELLYDLGIDDKKIKNTVLWVRSGEKLREKLLKFRRAAAFKPKSAMNRSMTSLATPTLDRWSQDLTRFAALGYFPSVIGREKEFEALFRTLEGGRGAILVGFQGVGKNTIIEGLAERMAEENVPELLYDKRLVSLNIADIISGATAGEAGKRMVEVFNDIARAGNIVLYVSHVERLAGVSSGAGGGEASDLLTLLGSEAGRGYFTCIASTDFESYRKVIEGGALSDMFEKIEVSEPKQDMAIQIVESAVSGIEAKNQVFFSYDSVERAVTLSDRYLHERYLPDKALEVLKEAAVAVRKGKGVNKFVSGEDIAKIVSEKAKIPVTAVTLEETEKLAKLEEKLHERVVGQNEAVDAVARALRRARAELRETKRPIANFLFLGPTGVGKTEAAKAVAAIYFGNEKNMIRLDMSEYQEKTSLARMIGVSGEKGGGLLTEAVRQQPFAMLLLDEIEKAHPDILNIFLQVMDDGRLTDNEGKTIDFTNVILIATSNAGTPFIQAEVQKNTKLEQIKDRLIREELKGIFRPEFLNRFDGVIVFKPLTKDEIEQITWLMLGRITKQLDEKGIEFEATDAAVRELASAGFDPVFGARPLRRVIQEKVEDEVAKLLLGQKLGRRDKIVFDAGGQVRVEKAKKL